ncbi:MAG: hypothetical protein IKJ80_00530 [Clostridia bacterium]|nr:hypothetical protein [Clostridia bacterium]
MTIAKVLERIDSLVQNTYTAQDKIAWLSRLDAMIKKTVIDTHEGAEITTFEGYDDRTDKNTELIVPEPYDDIYLYWLESQINYYNGEYDRYNTTLLMYQAALEAFGDYYRRDHMPKSVGSRFVF